MLICCLLSLSLKGCCYFRMTQSSFLVPGEGEEGSDVKVGSVEEEGSQCSSGFGSLPRKDRPSVISHGNALVI